MSAKIQSPQHSCGDFPIFVPNNIIAAEDDMMKKDEMLRGNGCCTIFGETPQAKMWLSSNKCLGEVDRLAQERPN